MIHKYVASFPPFAPHSLAQSTPAHSTYFVSYLIFQYVVAVLTSNNALQRLPYRYNIFQLSPHSYLYWERFAEHSHRSIQENGALHAVRLKRVYNTNRHLTKQWIFFFGFFFQNRRMFYLSGVICNPSGAMAIFTDVISIIPPNSLESPGSTRSWANY